MSSDNLKTIEVWKEVGGVLNHVKSELFNTVDLYIETNEEFNQAYRENKLENPNETMLDYAKKISRKSLEAVNNFSEDEIIEMLNLVRVWW